MDDFWAQLLQLWQDYATTFITAGLAIICLVGFYVIGKKKER